MACKVSLFLLTGNYLIRVKDEFILGLFVHWQRLTPDDDYYYPNCKGSYHTNVC